ncbi:MAG: condensation domain-containing protein, partial [Actinomycetota bacterium]|nr:condensation domain-containing protein [Actinomycetota bacterium]
DVLVADVSTVEDGLSRVRAGMDLTVGSLFRAALVTEGPLLLLAAHHLVVDGVSWRVLLKDLRTGCEQAAAGRPIDLGPKTTAFRDWARGLAERATAGGFDHHLPYWAQMVVDVPLVDGEKGRPDRAVTVSLSAEDTAALLRAASIAYRAQINDVLVAALSRVLSRWTGHDRVPLELEGHGREDVLDGIDLSRTVGWFTTLFPFTADLRGARDWGAVLRSVKEGLRGAHEHGLSHGALRWLTDREPADHRPVASLNYLGRFDTAGDELSYRVPGGIRLDRAIPTSGTASLDITASVTAGGELEIEWTHSPSAHTAATVSRLAEETLTALREIAAHCAESGVGGPTPSDFPLAGLSQAELDRVVGDARLVEDVYPLTPMQSGMLFHSLSLPGLYLEQACLTMTGVGDPAALERAWLRVVAATPVLRTSVVWEGLSEPMQVVRREVAIPVVHHDWRDVPATEREERLRRLLADDRATGIDPVAAPLMRLAFARVGETEVRVVWTFHHILLDGWSVFQILSDVLAVAAGQAPRPRRPFRDHVAWVLAQGVETAERHWRDVLAGFAEPTPLPFDRSPGRAHRSCSSSAHEFALSEEATTRVRAFARRNRLTLNTVVQGMWAILLARHGGRRDVCFGSVVSGRPVALPGADSIVGLLVNTIPVRVEVDTADVPGWLARLQAAQAAARGVEHLPLPRVQRLAALPPGVGLFDSVVVFENYPLDHQPPSDDGPRLADVVAVENTNYPLHLVAQGGAHPGEPLALQLGYDPELFDVTTVETLCAELAELLLDLARDAVPTVDLPSRPAAQTVAPQVREFHAPQGAVERTVADIWADVLAVERVGRWDDFFALGGDSLLGMRIAARLGTAFDLSVSPRALFDHPTVGALAAFVERPPARDDARDYEL